MEVEEKFEPLSSVNIPELTEITSTEALFYVGQLLEELIQLHEIDMAKTDDDHNRRPSFAEAIDRVRKSCQQKKTQRFSYTANDNASSERLKTINSSLETSTQVSANTNETPIESNDNAIFNENECENNKIENREEDRNEDVDENDEVNTRESTRENASNNINEQTQAIANDSVYTSASAQTTSSSSSSYRKIIRDAENSHEHLDDLYRRFWLKEVPPITIDDYLKRFHRYCPSSAATYLTAGSLLHMISVDWKTVPISRRNVYRLFAAAFLVSAKLVEDRLYSMKRYATTAGLSKEDTARLELSFLLLIDFNLTADRDVLIANLVDWGKLNEERLSA